MRLRYYDSLRNFIIAAKHSNLSDAADELHLTKGALSHQIKNLEAELKFDLFKRHSKGIMLTESGQSFLTTCQLAFGQIEQKAMELNPAHAEQTLTVGTTTYFASRWLSPRLMDFIRKHPDIRLRIQPIIDLFNLQQQGIDIAIRWGDGRWEDCHIEKLFDCPAWPTGNLEAKELIEQVGLEAAFSTFTLLRDREGSNVWTEWYQKAGLTPMDRADTLIVPDPNVRVQAVADGQGVALNDELIGREIEDGNLYRLSNVQLDHYGYFVAVEEHMQSERTIATFTDWLSSTAW